MTREQIIQSARIRGELKTIFEAEFSSVAKAAMASAYAGLVELVRQGDYEAAAILVNGITTPPPGIAVERMEEVKALILATFP